jgi:four helix bundle protein
LKRTDEEQQENEQPFRTFEDLEVYKKARQFRRSMYRVTRKLPDLEKYELASQIRRASVSLTNNIAEGHGRYHYLEQLKFLFQARGSLQELIDDLNVCEDEQYLPKSEVVDLKNQAKEVQRLISGYARYLRDRKFGSSLRVNETADEEEFLSELDLRFNNSTI